MAETLTENQIRHAQAVKRAMRAVLQLREARALVLREVCVHLQAMAEQGKTINDAVEFFSASQRESVDLFHRALCG